MSGRNTHLTRQIQNSVNDLTRLWADIPHIHLAIHIFTLTVSSTFGNMASFLLNKLKLTHSFSHTYTQFHTGLDDDIFILIRNGYYCSTFVFKYHFKSQPGVMHKQPHIHTYTCTHAACRYTLKPGHKTKNNNLHPYPLDNGSELKMNVIVEHMHRVYTPISVLIP